MPYASPPGSDLPGSKATASTVTSTACPAVCTVRGAPARNLRYWVFGRSTALARIAMATWLPAAGSTTQCSPRSVVRPSRTFHSRAPASQPRIGPSESIVAFHRFGQTRQGPITNASWTATPPSGSGRPTVIWSWICFFVCGGSGRCRRANLQREFGSLAWVVGGTGVAHRHRGYGRVLLGRPHRGELAAGAGAELRNQREHVVCRGR